MATSKTTHTKPAPKKAAAPKKPAAKKAAPKTAPKKAAPAKKAAPKAEGFDWPKPPREILIAYLKANVTDAQDAPNTGAPFITENGILRIRSEHWRAWLVDQGIAPSKSEATAPIRELGFSMKPYALPGEGRSHGFYTGELPKSKLPGLGKLPIRKATRTAAPRNPFKGLTDGQRAELLDALADRPESELRDELAGMLSA
jgi:hypothetical protein